MDMESSTSQDVHGGTALVQQYLQDVEPSGTGVEGQSHLTQLSSQCILLFQIILKALRAKRSSASQERLFLDISLERSYERFKIWSDENGMADGNLDAKLEGSRDLQRDTLKYVVSIGQALTDRLVNILDADLGDAGYKSISMLRSLTAAVMEGDSDTSSDSGFSDASVVSVNGVLEDLRVDTTCLLDLEPLLCSPISRMKTEPIALLDTTRIKWSPHQPYSEKVSARFPMAADDLVARLGKANYERYLRCQEQKATNELGPMPPGQTASSVPDGASSKFHDSGVGSSLPTTGSAYAETVMSYGAEEGRRVRVPPLPDEAKKGLPFACVVCGKWVTITTNSAWKQHVYGDLEPWICLEAGCTSATKTFPTRNDWISHISLDHRMGPGWRMIQCPLCRDDVGPGKLPITRHFSDHLEEISLSALPAEYDFDDESKESVQDGEGKTVEIVGRASDIQNIYEERMFSYDESWPSIDENISGPPKQTSNEREIELTKYPHKCPYCDTGFTRHHNLKSHLLTHSQEKPYLCQTCNLRFRRLHDLKRHGKLHTGERPHVCPKCDRKFARREALARHSKGAGGCAGRRASVGSYGDQAEYDGVPRNDGDDRLRKLEGIVGELSGQIGVEAASNRPSSEDSPGTIVENKGKVLNGPSGAADETTLPNSVGDSRDLNPGTISGYQYDEAGKGKAKQQVVASPLPDMEDDESVFSPPPQSDYFPGWTSEANFDWPTVDFDRPIEATGGDHGAKGKGKAPADAAAVCDGGDSSPGLSSVPIDIKNQLEAYSSQASQYPPPTQSSIPMTPDEEYGSNPSRSYNQKPIAKPKAKLEAQPPSDFGNLDSTTVDEAMEIVRDSPDGARDPVVSGILESALTQLWDRVTAQPESYIMSTSEFTVFNFYQHRFVGNKLAVAARRRFWDNTHT